MAVRDARLTGATAFLMAALPALVQDPNPTIEFPLGEAADHAGQAMQEVGQAIDQALLDMTVDDFEDREVVGADGEEIGEIEELVRIATGLGAVVELDDTGFLDLGEREIVVPLQRVSATADGHLMLGTLTEEPLAELEPFEEGAYERVTGYDTIGDAYDAL